MSIVIPEWQYYGGLAAIVLVPLFAAIIMLSIFKEVPWAWTMYQCSRANVPYILKLYPRGGAEGVKPIVEKDLKAGIPVTYYRIDQWGEKFPDNGEYSINFHNKLRIIPYFKKSLSPIGVMDAVALDRLKDWLNKKGLNIHNREDAVLFFLNEYSKTKDIQEIIEASSVEDEESKNFILKTIKTIEDNREELTKLKVTDGVFTFQTAMMAVDRLMAFTSAAFADAKSAIQAQVRAEREEDKNKEFYKTILIMFVGIVIAVFAYLMLQKGL